MSFSVSVREPNWYAVVFQKSWTFCGEAGSGVIVHSPCTVSALYRLMNRHRCSASPPSASTSTACSSAVAAANSANAGDARAAL